jgi:import receptor subunit TOM6
MSGRIPVAKESYFAQIQKTPAFTIAVHAGLFAAGVAFIQSPLMEMLVPQL